MLAYIVNNLATPEVGGGGGGGGDERASASIWQPLITEGEGERSIILR